MQVVRRVGLIGDLHCENDALVFVLEQLGKLGAETLLQVGDIADGPGDLDATVELLEAHRVLAVRGNHDRWLLRNQLRDMPHANALASLSPATVAFLTRLPVTREFRSPRGNVLLCHGLDSNDMVGVRPDHDGVVISTNEELQRLIRERRYRFVLNGHTHRAMLRTFGPLSIVNAGTLFREYEQSFTFVDFERGELVRHSVEAGRFSTDLGAWRQERQILADSPSEPFREPFL